MSEVTPDALPFACACGRVAGVIDRASPRDGDHVVCHCRDCQRFAHHLNAAGRILDAQGGTALFQSRCARMRLVRGRDELACVHLTDKPTLRWYARCCSTPLFNTYANGRIPYITTVVANADATARQRLLGPPIGHLFVEEATTDVGEVPRLSMAGMMRRFLPRMVRDIVSGDRRRAELFDARTLAPIVPPVRVTA